MKVLQKSSALILTVILIVSVVAPGASAFGLKKNALPEEYKNEYPFIFVHGFNGWGGSEGLNTLVPYWGATCGNLMDYLTSEGYECYSASVGPLSSAWDRACELYAQLTGTRVDYGEAHSKEHNHKRYGRTYESPLFDGWGEKDSEGNIKKVHLIGHSFGGTTVRMLTFLLTYGCKDEISASGKDVSPLFKGGNENLVHSVTTICTPHNSSSIYYFTKELMIFEPLLLLSAVYAGTLGRSPLNGLLVDFHLEQFGLTNTPGSYDSELFIKALKRYVESDDCCQYDLTPEGTQIMNDMLELSPNVYYYSYAFSSTHEDSVFGITLPNINSNPLLAPLACYMGHHKDFNDSFTGQLYDESWHSSDSLCNTISETYPFDEAHRDYDGNDVKGIWNVMPIQTGDHGQAIGLLEDRNKHREFYVSLSQMLVNIE